MESVNEYIFTEDIYQLPPKPVVIIDKPWMEISQEEITLLSKILGAINHSLDSVTIVSQSSLDLSNLSYTPKAAICFSSAPKGLSLYDPLEAEQVSIVISEPLSSLISSDSSKKQLWQALKKQFKL